MLTEIAEFRARDEHRIEVRFKDGVEGVVDLSSMAGHGVFGPLRSPAELARAALDEFGVAFYGDKGIDRSPRGTGTSARIARMTRPNTIFVDERDAYWRGFQVV